jgi:hypothetical protein
MIKKGVHVWLWTPVGYAIGFSFSLLPGGFRRRGFSSDPTEGQKIAYCPSACRVPAAEDPD